jgi:hypothetical protein
MEPFAIFLPQTVRAEVDIDVKKRNRGTQHVTIFAEDGTPVGLQFDEALLLLPRLVFPVITLYLLDVQHFAENHHSEHNYADEAEVNSP